MQSFEAVYARMLFAAGVRTQSELAEVLGLRQASISEAKKRKSIPSQWCMRLYDACGVRVDWQRQGVGPVYDEKKLAELELFRHPEWNWQEPSDLPGVLREPETLPLATGPETERPVYGTLKTADGLFPEVGYQTFPKEFLSDEVQIFRIQDAKMAPVLNKGALAAVAKLAPESGGLAAIVDGRELMFRRIRAVDGGWEVTAEAAEERRFISEAEWPLSYYGKAVWAFQPLH